VSGSVTITEVGPRDGLQNERSALGTEAKVAFVHDLVDAGVRHVEVTSFVHPGRVPAMADAEDVFRAVNRREGVRYIALTPNRRGWDRARSVGCDAVAVLTAASEGFTGANLGMSIPDTLARIKEVTDLARGEGVWVRGYVSTIFACPYNGPVDPEVVTDLTEQILDLGCDEVSLGDTIGVGTPSDVRRLLDVMAKRVPMEALALHCHDTWGMAAVNVMAALEYGMRIFDGSAGGLGGCPFAPGATGNAATEDLGVLLHGLGYDTGLDLGAVAAAAARIGEGLDHPLTGRAHNALLSRAKSTNEGDTC